MKVFFKCCLVFLIISCAGEIFSQQTENGFFIDDRDGQVYKTVKIGSQLWMSENLNFGSFENLARASQQLGEKYCYDNDTSKCSVYGGLYTWDVASSENLCPDGWHLPSKEEWQQLAKYLGEEEAGQKVKVTPNDKISWDGNNESGLSVIPSGVSNGFQFIREGQWAIFWTDSPNGEDRAWFAQLDSHWYPMPEKYKKIIIDSFYLKSNLLSVRCIKDYTEKK